MKTIFLSLFLFALSCGGPQKTVSPKNETTPNTEDVSKIEETIVAPKVVKKEELILHLKDINSDKDVKTLIINSGLDWDKLIYDKNASKIALIKVPEEKTDFWIHKLEESNQFKKVALYKPATLKSIISEIESSLVSLRKTACYGHCPIFEVSIDKQGKVFYNGIKYVLVKGKREFKLTDKQFVKLKNILNKTSFSSYKSSYNNSEISDLPSTYITYNNKEIQLRVWGGVPSELAIATEHIEDILLAKKFYEL